MFSLSFVVFNAVIHLQVLIARCVYVPKMTKENRGHVCMAVSVRIFDAHVLPFIMVSEDLKRTSMCSVEMSAARSYWMMPGSIMRIGLRVAAVLCLESVLGFGRIGFPCQRNPKRYFIGELRGNIPISH